MNKRPALVAALPLCRDAATAVRHAVRCARAQMGADRGFLGSRNRTEYAGVPHRRQRLGDLAVSLWPRSPPSDRAGPALVSCRGPARLLTTRPRRTCYRPAPAHHLSGTYVAAPRASSARLRNTERPPRRQPLPTPHRTNGSGMRKLLNLSAATALTRTTPVIAATAAPAPTAPR